jgi:hypothetical protein
MSASMTLKPRTDDRVICDLAESATGCFAVAVAHDVGVFRLLAAGPRTATELCAALGIGLRELEALLILCVSARLVRVENGLYTLMPVAEEYLVESSPVYAGWLFDLWSDDETPFSFRRLHAAVMRKEPWPHGTRPWVDRHRQDAGRAASFTRIMHGHSMAPALAWPEKLDLGDCRRLLDVGGGSGAHSIGALMHWPRLEAIVLDLPSVCIAARDYIERYGMTRRITTCAADMWTDAWPEADIHFYSDIFHDWTPEECRALARKSHARLPAGGRIIVHEMLYDDDKRGPFTVAASSLAMLTWCGGQQFSGLELSSLLRECGFEEIEVVPTFGYWSVVTGRRR